MHKQFQLPLLFVLSFFVFDFSFVQFSQAADLLPIEDYMQQVKGKNGEVLSAGQLSEAGLLRSSEGEIVLAPTLYSKLSTSIDGKRTQFSALLFQEIVTQQYSLGVSKTTSFGLDIKFHYDLYSQYYLGKDLGASAASIGSAFNLHYNNASPVLELRQALWKNGFGRSTRALRDKTEADALNSSYSSSYLKKTYLSKAEVAYWKLAIARSIVLVQKEALDQSQKNYDWNVKRAKMHLAEEADIALSEAALRQREIELLSAQNDERAATHDFNLLRGLESEVVGEVLTELKLEITDQVQIPKRQELTDDLRAEQEKFHSSVANAQISIEKSKPQLDIYATLSLNGQVGYVPPAHLDYAVAKSFGTQNPSYVFGLDFSMPLNFETVNNSQEGWVKEQMAAELAYASKTFEQNQAWKNLVEKFKEQKQHLELSKKLELAQKSKLEIEKVRLKQGRTSLDQVLRYEQDHLQAQVIRIRDQGSILTTVAEMKQYGETL